MKARVITVLSIPESVSASQRCIAASAAFGLHVEPFPAVTGSQSFAMFTTYGWPTLPFLGNRFSRPDRCMACFASHALLWDECVRMREPVLVLEHDAIQVAALPDLTRAGLVCNLGRPSFGTFKQPPCGNGPLVSKPHMPGAHAYLVTPQGAEELLCKAKTEAEPADVFMALKRFPFIRETYPWAFECRDEVTTVQGPLGCRGKHRPVRIV